jgi:hypothetical protein
MRQIAAPARGLRLIDVLFRYRPAGALWPRKDSFFSAYKKFCGGSRFS